MNSNLHNISIKAKIYLLENEPKTPPVLPNFELAKNLGSFLYQKQDLLVENQVPGLINPGSRGYGHKISNFRVTRKNLPQRNTYTKYEYIIKAIT